MNPRKKRKSKLSSLGLKIIALCTMLIDHTAVALMNAGILSAESVLYGWMRLLGRIAFPIFCFQLSVGAVRTKSPSKYALRLLLLALLSELPFDLAIFGTRYAPRSQNVFFTLLSGLLCILFLKTLVQRMPEKKAAVTVLYLISVGCAAFLAEKVLCSDYGQAGIYMIAVMGLLNLPLEKIRKEIPDERLLRLVFCGAGILLCSFFSGSTEKFALAALLPLYFYNGKKGYTSQILKWGFYLFYPVHLLALWAVFLLPAGI